MSLVSRLMNSHPYLSALYERAKALTLPGFDNIPLYDVFVFFRNEVRRNVISVRAKAIAFTFFLALFPALLFLFTLIPYIPIPNLQNDLIKFIKEFLPHEAFVMLETTITGVIKEQRGELLSIGLFLALFISTNGVMAMMESFDKSYAVFVKRSRLKMRLVALGLTLILFFLLVVSIITIVEGNLFLKSLLKTFNRLNQFNFILFSTLKWIIIILLFFNSISLIYYYGPAVRKKFRFVSAGSTLATFLVILISIGFSYFVNNFGSYNRFYGSIGAIIALQIYIYLNAFAMLIGFELNASIAISKNIREHRPDVELQSGDV
ncbi:MAG TPA: YihY/virulence factor BrkB family protein [Chitinophagales bacterium]|nr:YihY/virulence factor BrkB family protein [Chitinophagales bacterium]